MIKRNTLIIGVALPLIIGFFVLYIIQLNAPKRDGVGTIDYETRIFWDTGIVCREIRFGDWYCELEK